MSYGRPTGRRGTTCSGCCSRRVWFRRFRARSSARRRTTACGVAQPACCSRGTTMMLDAGPLARLPSLPPAETPNVAAHPAVRAGIAAIETVQARERALARTYTPRVDVQGAFSGRGSGAEVPGQRPGGDGLSLDVPNWAVGVTVSFPVLERFSVNARKRVEAQTELAR